MIQSLVWGMTDEESRCSELLRDFHHERQRLRRSLEETEHPRDFPWRIPSVA